MTFLSSSRRVAPAHHEGKRKAAEELDGGQPAAFPSSQFIGGAVRLGVGSRRGL